MTTNGGKRPNFRERLAGSLFRRMLKLPEGPAEYTIERDVRIPARDGVDLLAQHWAPVGDAVGTVVVHSPYGWNALWGAVYGAPYASQGYHVLLVSARGTFGSGGIFEPMLNESSDTHDVAKWLREQTWFGGRFAMVGASYLGFAQWAMLLDPPPELVAAVIQVGPHDFARAWSDDGAIKLNDMLAWSEFVARQEEFGVVRALVRLATISKRIEPALSTVPLSEGAAQLLGSGAPWFKRWIENQSVDAAYWESARLSAALDRVNVPVLLHTGWHDIFLDQTMEQYRHLSARGVKVGLTVGPWTHNDIEEKAAPQLVGEALDWLAPHFGVTVTEGRRENVKVFVSGAEAWEGFTVWPPETEEVAWYPQSSGLLNQHPDEGAMASFVFDPEDPTPSIGGRLMTAQGGRQDDSALARRNDVLTFTSAPLDNAVDLMGCPVVTLAHNFDTPTCDVFVRVSDVDPKGHSRNVTESLVRLDGASHDQIRIVLDPTSHHFVPGNRIRLVVGGGSFPRWSRNPGTGGDALTSTSMKPTHHTLDLGGSKLALPTRNATEIPTYIGE